MARLAVPLAALSGVLLALPFIHGGLFPLTWVAFVPLLAALRHASPGRAYRLGLICGLVFYGLGAFWIVEFLQHLWSPGPVVTAGLALLFWLYSAQLPALLMLTFQWLRRRTGWSALLLFPVLASLFFARFPMLFQAQLGESQSLFLTALQPLAWAGVHALDAVIALVNVLLYRWLCNPPRAPLIKDRAGLVAAAVPVLWLGLGSVLLHHWDHHGHDNAWHRVGFVQENTPPGGTSPAPGHGFAYPRALALSEPLVRAGADLVVWPETGFDDYFAHPRVAAALRRSVAGLDAALIFQGMQVEDGEQFNSAALIGRDGEEQGRYRKIQRVAFGEYLPLLEAFPRTGSRVREQLGGFFSKISAGERPGRFAVAGLEALPLICYEALFPELVANAARGGGAAELLVVLSNNAWFGASRQPYQHLNASALRAVENRRPLLHVINNGPSTVVLPSGRRLLQSEYGREAAYWVDVPMPASAADSFFTRHPGLFLHLVFLTTALALGRAAVDVNAFRRSPAFR